MYIYENKKENIKIYIKDIPFKWWIDHYNKLSKDAVIAMLRHRFHNEKGPAIVDPVNGDRYFINGEEITTKVEDPKLKEEAQKKIDAINRNGDFQDDLNEILES